MCDRLKSNWNYIGTADDGTTSDIIIAMFKIKESRTKTKHTKQMKIFDFEQFLYIQRGGANLLRFFVEGCSTTTLI